MSRIARKFGFYLVALLLCSLALAACDNNATTATTAPTNTPMVVGATNTSAISGGMGNATAEPNCTVTASGKVCSTFSTVATALSGDGMPMTGTGGMGGGQTGTAKIGAILSLSGAAAPYGTSQKNGLEMARDDINAMAGGLKLELDIQDDASKADQAGQVMQKLVSAKSVLVIGPTLSNGAFTADPIAQQAGIPVLAISNTADKISGKNGIGEYIFRASLSERQAIPPTIKAAKAKLNFSKAALLFGDDDAFTKSGAEVFKQALADNGVQIVATETYKKGATDFSGQISNIKAAAPDVIVVSGLIAEAIPVVKQMRDAGVTLPIIGGNGFNNPRLFSKEKGAGDAAENVIVGAAWNIASDNPKSADFITRYQAKFGSNPDQFAAQAYTGLHVAYFGIKNAKSMSGADVAAALRTVSYNSVMGAFKFNADQDPDMAAVVQIVQGGKFAIYK